MADELGSAVLRITVDDSAAKASLKTLREEINAVNKSARTAGATGSRAGGARENVRALEQAQERRFRLAQQINRLEERGANVSRLRQSLGDLTTAQANRQFELQRRLSVDLNRQIRLAQARLRTEQETAKALERQQQAAQRAGGARSPLRGTAADVGSAAFSARGASQGGASLPIDALEKSQQRRFRLSQQINRLEEQGANVDRLRTSLGRLTEAQSTRQFELQRRLSVDLDRQVKLAQARLRVERETATVFERQQRSAERAGGPRSPVRGAVDIPGSPAFLEAQRRFDSQALSRSVSIGGPRSPVGGSIAIPGSPAALAAARKAGEAEARAYQQELTRAARNGGARSPVGGATNILGSPAFLAEGERQFQLLQAAGRKSVAKADRLRNNWTSFLSDLDETAQIIRSNRKAETLQLRLDRAQQQRSQQTSLGRTIANKTGSIVSSGLIGGGFPLLFGQGAGAAAGGLAGGLAGGALGGGFGFALSVVGTAIGAAFDQTLEKGKTLAAGLNDPIGQFDALRQASLISSSAVERQAAALIANGREAEAAALVQLDLAKQYGDTSDLEALRSASDELNRAFTRAGVVIANFVAGPLADFLSKLASSTNALVLQGQVDQRVSSAPASVQSEVAAFRDRRTSELSGTGTVTDVSLQINQEINALLDRRLGKTKEVQAAEQASNNASRARLATEKLTYQLIDATTDGYKEQALQLERQRLIRERNDKITALPSNRTQGEVDAINKQYAPQLYQNEKQLLDLRQDRLAAQIETNAQNAIELGAIQRQTAAAQQLASTEGERSRAELQRRQQIIESINAARDAELRLGAQIDAARTRGGDAGEQEAQRLVGQQLVAAEQTRLKLIEGADALTQAGRQLRDDLNDSVLKLAEVRGAPQGLNRFLSQSQQQQRAEEDFQRLLPQFREAQGQFQRLTGATAPEFSGSATSVNAAIIDFIRTVKAESDATRNVADIQQALSNNISTLASVTSQLASVNATLAAKDWNVSVNISGDGQANVFGDAIPSAV